MSGSPSLQCADMANETTLHLLSHQAPLRESAHSFALFLIIFFTIYLTVSCVVFRIQQPHYVFLRKRPFKYVVAKCMLSGIGVLSYTAVYDYVGAANFPCWLLIVLFHTFAATSPIPLTLKMAQYSNEVAAVNLAKKLNTEQQESSMNSNSNGGPTPAPIYFPASCTRETFAAYVRLTFGSRGGKTATLRDKVLRLQFMRSYGFIAIYLPLPLILGWIAIGIHVGTNPWVHMGCAGCRLGPMDFALQLANVSCGVVLCMLTLPAQALRRDPLRILREVRDCFATYVIVGIAYIICLADPGGVTATGQFNWLILSLITSFALVYITTWHQILVAKRLRKILFTVNQNRDECYAETMADPTLKKELRQHLDSELSSEIYLFLEYAELYRTKRAGGKHSPESVAKCGQEMFDLFIKRGARNEVNLSARVRDPIIRAFTHGGEIPEDVFMLAEEEVLDSFLDDGFVRFMAKMTSRSNAATVFAITLPSPPILSTPRPSNMSS